jgi:ribosomal protein L34E
MVENMKIKTEVIYCDKCGEEIPKVQKKDNKDVIEIQKKCRSIGIDLCDECVKDIKETF